MKCRVITPALRPFSFRATARNCSIMALTCVLALSGCGLRIGEGTRAALPTLSASQQTQDALARRTALINSAAQLLAKSGSAEVAAVAKGSASQLRSLGGVWQPWHTTPPTGYPTVSPVPTAGSDTTTAQLVMYLKQGTGEALKAASESSGKTAQTYASIGLTWASWARALDGTNFDKLMALQPRTGVNLTSPLQASTLNAYDQARYGLEVIAAQSGDGATAAQAKAAGDTVDACLAIKCPDQRLSSYQLPSGNSYEQGASLWLNVVSAELSEVANAKDEAQRKQAISAAAWALVQAQSWNASLTQTEQALGVK